MAFVFIQASILRPFAFKTLVLSFKTYSMLNFYLKKTTVSFAFLFFVWAAVFGQEPHLVFTPRIPGLIGPVQVANAGDGSNRLFLVNQGSAGTATIVVYDQNYSELDTFLKVTNITTGGEEGLLSMAFHPEYANAASPFFGFFYVYYTNSNGDLEIARYKVSGNPHVADAASKDTVITIPHPTYGNHNGGTINFGNDGYLYLATGDGGSGGDPPNNAQNPITLLGKLIRIDVTSSDSPPFYAIPPSNPYTGVTIPDTLDEIYALGLRNPFRWSFDKTTHDIWIGDVGQNAWEEINYRRADSVAKTNYGWRCYEGIATYDLSVGCVSPPYTFPVYTYPNPGGSAVTGGFVYRGSFPANAALTGYYLATDYYSGTLYKIKPNGSGGWTVYAQTDGVRSSISHFGETETGEILAVSQFPNSTLYTISVDVVLPAKLVSFTAQPINDRVQLKWKTVFEENLSRFEVEFSTDGINFSKAGVVAAANIITGTEYSFSHTIPFSRRVFYRLKMINIDNSAELSTVVSVETGITNKDFVRPSFITSGLLSIYLEKSYKVVELISIKGSVVLKEKIDGRTGRIDIPVSYVASGTYIVRLRNNESTLEQKVIIR
jgi:glucose/arabinose dehydrogenase